MQTMFLRLALIFIACGAFVFSRVLVVQNDPYPFGAISLYVGGGPSSSGNAAAKALAATGGGASTYGVGVKSVDRAGPFSRMAALRTRLAAQVGSCADGVGRVGREIGSRLPRLRSQTQPDIRWGQKGLDFAQQLAKRLSGRQRELSEGQAKGGMDARHAELVRQLEEEGETALSEDNWRLVGEKEDMRIWRREAREGGYGQEYPCVKVSKVMEAPADRVMDLILDNGRVREYNRYSHPDGRTDVEHLGPNTRIVRNRTLPPLCKKPHEFCTLLHVIKRDDGSRVLLTKFTDHPKVPRSNDFMRSEIILGVTEVRPHPSGRPDRVVFTTVSHVKSAGVPAFMADKFSVKGVVDFVDNMEAVLKGEARRGQ